MLRFFVPMIPPTTTAQMRQVRVVRGKPTFYEPPAVADARARLTAHMAQHRPAAPLTGALRLVVKWCFPLAGKHQDGDYRTTRPDTDNLQKLLKDVLTALGYWHDDAQVASEIVEKFWAATPGLFVQVEQLDAGHPERCATVRAGATIGGGGVSRHYPDGDRRAQAKSGERSQG